MPVLGTGGRVLFQRPRPASCEVALEDFYPSCNKFVVNCPSWWNGDYVCVDQLPIYIDGVPVNPDGYASYQGSVWHLGPNRTQISSNDDLFYKDNTESYPDDQFGDDADFYAREGVGDVPTGNGNGCYWVHIDEFGYASFYGDRCSAIAGCGDIIELAPTWFDGAITLFPSGTQDYENAFWNCDFNCINYQDGYVASDVIDSVDHQSLCQSAPEYNHPSAGVEDYDNADVLPRPSRDWPHPQALCGIRDFSLTLDAPGIDTTAVGEKFGEAVKSLVSGGGSFEFFLDRQCLGESQEDASWMMMNLLMQTGGGCSVPVETEAWFYLMEGNGCNSCFPPVGGALYYKANILITQTAVNVRPAEIVAGTAEFITTGPIKLLQGPSHP